MSANLEEASGTRVQSNPCSARNECYARTSLHRLEGVAAVGTCHASWMRSSQAIRFYLHICTNKTSILGLVFQFDRIDLPLTLLEPQSRFGDKLVKFQVVCLQNGTAVLKGLTQITKAFLVFHFFTNRMPLHFDSEKKNDWI